MNVSVSYRKVDRGYMRPRYQSRIGYRCERQFSKAAASVLTTGTCTCTGALFSSSTRLGAGEMRCTRKRAGLRVSACRARA